MQLTPSSNTQYPQSFQNRFVSNNNQRQISSSVSTASTAQNLSYYHNSNQSVIVDNIPPYPSPSNTISNQQWSQNIPPYVASSTQVATSSLQFNDPQFTQENSASRFVPPSQQQFVHSTIPPYPGSSQQSMNFNTSRVNNVSSLSPLSSASNVPYFQNTIVPEYPGFKSSEEVNTNEFESLEKFTFFIR